MVRRQRQWVAGLVMLGVVFAQVVTVAHACTLAMPALEAFGLGQSTDEAMPAGCATMPKGVAANAKVCELHCAYGQQIDVQPDAPVAAIAPQRVLTVCVVSSILPSSFDKTFLHARSTAPPVSLLFSRFLI